MYGPLLEAVRTAKFVHLGYRSHAPNQWDRLILALEIADTLEQNDRRVA